MQRTILSGVVRASARSLAQPLLRREATLARQYTSAASAPVKEEIKTPTSSPLSRFSSGPFGASAATPTTPIATTATDLSTANPDAVVKSSESTSEIPFTPVGIRPEWKFPEFLDGAPPTERLHFAYFFFDFMPTTSIAQSTGSHIWTVIKNVFNSIQRSPNPQALLAERWSQFGISEDRYELIRKELEQAYEHAAENAKAKTEENSLSHDQQREVPSPPLVSSKNIRLKLNESLPEKDEFGEPSRLFVFEEIMASELRWKIETSRDFLSKYSNYHNRRFGKTFDYSPNAPLWKKEWPKEEWLHNNPFIRIHDKLIWAYLSYEGLPLSNIHLAIGGMLDESVTAVAKVLRVSSKPKELVKTHWDKFGIDAGKTASVLQTLKEVNTAEMRLSELLNLITTKHGENFVNYGELKLLKVLSDVELGLLVDEIPDADLVVPSKYNFPTTSIFETMTNREKLIWADFAFEKKTLSELSSKYRMSKFDIGKLLMLGVRGNPRSLAVLVENWDQLETDPNKAHLIYAVLQQYTVETIPKTLAPLMQQVQAAAGAEGSKKRVVSYENLLFEKTRFLLEIREKEWQAKKREKFM